MFTDKIWFEKYRPRKVADCILKESIRKQVDSFVSSQTVPNLLLCGSAGTGKTTLAKALCEELNYEYIMINGSNEGRLLDTIRSKIVQFAASMSMEGKRKCVIIDEADYMPNEPQAALRNFIEEFSGNCSFILTCNFPNRLMEAIHSRCAVVDFTMTASDKKDLTERTYKRMRSILQNEGVEFDKQVLATMIVKFFPDMRRLLNELQRLGSTGVIDSGSLASLDGGDMTTLISLLKNRDFGGLKKWVATTPNTNLEQVCREIYDRLYDICKNESMPQVVITLADYQYRDQFVADKEINMMAMFTSLIQEVEFK